MAKKKGIIFVTVSETSPIRRIVVENPFEPLPHVKEKMVREAKRERERISSLFGDYRRKLPVDSAEEDKKLDIDFSDYERSIPL